MFYIKKFSVLINKAINHFIISQHGTAMLVIGLGLFAIVSVIGVSVDMSRAQLAQARIGSALDTAGLAAAATISTNNINSEAAKYFNANFPTGYMGTTLGTLMVTSSEDNRIISLSITGTVPTTFMKIAGIENIPISASSEITRENKGLEVVLVMDTTGSMNNSAGGSTSKITAAKNAATTMVNILYGSNETIDNLWIGLVPFSQAVNIGSTRTSWVESDSFNWGPTSWAGCVESRSNGTLTPQYDINDDNPSTRLFPKYYAPDNNSTNNWKSSSSYTITNTKGPNVYCPQAITPMTSSKTTMLNAISSMTTGGNTHINLGLAWGWRLLSPKWRNLWGGEMNTHSLPLDYNTPLMNKAVVLMTDGDNTLSDNYYSAYGYPSDGQLGSNACVSSWWGVNCTNGENELNTRTQTVCNSMKNNNNNIIIYTVALGTNIGTTAKNILKNCASKPEYYFDSPTTDDLSQAFSQIGDSLANLRISK